MIMPNITVNKVDDPCLIVQVSQSKHFSPWAAMQDASEIREIAPTASLGNLRDTPSINILQSETIATSPATLVQAQTLCSGFL